MEVKSANYVLQGNRAAVRVDNYGSHKRNEYQYMKEQEDTSEEQKVNEDNPVMLSLSVAGLRRSMLLERQQSQKEEAFSHEKMLEEMSKKMEGVSSQVINGSFSVSDRLNFHHEIQTLTEELSNLKETQDIATQNDCSLLSQKITNFSKIVNDAALYRRSAQEKFMHTSMLTSRLQYDSQKSSFNTVV